MRSFVLIATLALAVGAEVLPLHEAQQMMMAGNPELRAARYSVESARAAVDETKASWWPSVDVKGSYQWLSERSSISIDMPQFSLDRTIGRNDRTELGIDCSWPVFTGFSRKLAGASSRRQVELAEDMDSISLNRLSLMLGLLYLQWQFSGREIAMKNTLISQLDAYAKSVGAQFEAGVTVRSRLLDARARLTSAQADLAASRQKQDSLRIEIIALIGDTTITAEVDTAATVHRLIDDASEVLFDTLRPELQTYRGREEILSINRRIVENRRFPTLAALAGLRYADPGLAMGSEAFMGYGLVGVQFSWNLFNGFANEAKVRQIDAQKAALVCESEQQELALRKTLQLSKAELVRLSDRMAAAVMATAAAKALSDDLENCLASGTVTQVDYLNALTAVHSARLIEEQLKTAREMAALRALYAAGVRLEY